MVLLARRVSRSVGPWVLVLGAVVLTASSGCTLTAKLTCAPGDRLACDCENGVVGYATCEADGSEYGACDCSGKKPWLPGGSAVTDGGDASRDQDNGTSALKGDGEPCDGDAQCASGLCYSYTSKGTRCSRSCTPQTAAADCPPPFEGCNNKNVCKLP